MTSYSRSIFWSSWVITLLLACSLSGCTSSQSTVATTATTVLSGGSNSIAIKNFAFSPATLTIKTGTTVTWINGDGAVHQVTSDSGTPVVFTSDTLANGASYHFTFTEPGIYTYHCTIHPSMKGTIIVES